MVQSGVDSNLARSVQENVEDILPGKNMAHTESTQLISKNIRENNVQGRGDSFYPTRPDSFIDEMFKTIMA